MHSILIVEDRVSVRTMMADYLKQTFEVVIASDGREALIQLQHHTFACILLDLMMPGMDGFTFLSELRTQYTTPVMVISARLDEADKIHALELGADEYVTKPISMREVAARVNAIIRRTTQAYGETSTQEPIRIDEKRRCVIIRQQEYTLTSTEFKILNVLYQHHDEAISRTTISMALQTSNSSNIDRAIDVHIRNIRNKIEPNPDEPRYILTVYGVGYRLKL
jgi:DNA-binding response OmpR family regulator